MSEAESTEPRDLYAGSIRRIEISTVLLTALGGVFFALRYSWRSALGLLLGAVLGAVNFYLFKRLADSLGTVQNESGSRRGPAAVLLGFRFLLIGFAVFAIIKLLGINAVPVIAGLLLPACAVIIESSYLLIAGPAK